MSDFPSVNQKISGMFSPSLSIWPLNPSPKRRRHPAVTPPHNPVHLYLHPDCLDANTPVLSLNSQINKLPLSSRKIPSDLWSTSAQQRPSRAESGPSSSTTENQLGVTDLKKVKYLGGLVEARGEQRLIFQVDNGGTVKVERVFLDYSYSIIH